MSDEPAPLQPEPCLNCGTMVELEFCPACGQRRGDFRKSLLRLIGDVFRETTEFDGRFGRTLRGMLRPGRITREFNQGKRQRYVSPVRLYLFVSLLMFAAASLSLRLHTMMDPPEGGVTQLEFNDGTDETATGFDRLLQERIDELGKLPPAERDQKIFSGALDNGPLLMFVLLPVFALLLKLVFLGTGGLYVEHLVFSLHVHSVWFLLAIPALAIPYAWSAVFLLPIPFYTVFALQHAYDASWWATALRSMALGFLYFNALALGMVAALFMALLLG
ncbi:MAG: DUF3667 domain-containing protein [Myxococcota bacterium]